MDYSATRARVEHYFDRTATQVWVRLTSDAPVSGIRQTVREGREAMRARLLSRLPQDLSGMRVLDAGCGPGVMTAILAERGAEVVAADLSPQLLLIAADRLPAALQRRVTFHAGDMTDPSLGRFDAVIAMDSLIYYAEPDLIAALGRLSARAPRVLFTVAPRTALLSVMFGAGKLFPRGDRSPTMVPQSTARLKRRVPGLADRGRVARGFYISQALELAA